MNGARAALIEATKREMGESHLERSFIFFLRMDQLPRPERQLRFDIKGRRWRFDFAWPDIKVAVEIDGGIRNHGAHVRAEGFMNDCQKINEAQIQGWRVFRFTKDMIESHEAIEFMKKVFKTFSNV